jgi:hypothetical protein
VFLLGWAPDLKMGEGTLFELDMIFPNKGFLLHKRLGVVEFPIWDVGWIDSKLQITEGQTLLVFTFDADNSVVNRQHR